MTFEVPLQLLLVFFLVLSRITGLVLLTPIFSSANMPVRMRAFLAVSLAVLVTPLQSLEVGFHQTSWLQLAPLFAGEILLGLMMGFGIRLLFTGVQLAGQVIGHMSGMQLADVYDPGSDTNIPVFSQLLDMLMLAVFLVIGGHRRLMGALLDSFQTVPVGAARMQNSAIEDLKDVFGASFHLSLQVGAPAMIALLAATLILGFVSRTLPQINAIQVGFNVNSMIIFLVLMVSIGAMVGLFEGQFDWLMERLKTLPFLPDSTGELTDAHQP